jgi:uncharacterized SAM-binding protein YcdF (DUF218 family)
MGRPDGNRTTRAILVLGAAVWSGGRPSPTLERRTAKAARLWHEGAGQVVIPCGGVGRYPPSEAEVMRTLLGAAGVPDSAIHLEDTSTSTAENITEAKLILDRLGIGAVVIVSDAYHLPRARMIARRSGLEVETASPPLRGARVRTVLKGTLREIPAYLAEYLGLRRQ